MAKYDPLLTRLSSAGSSVVLPFTELDEMIGGLPPSARRYAAWWSKSDVPNGAAAAADGRSAK